MMTACTADDDAILGVMSPVAREIAEAIGIEATIDLLCRRKLGGKRIFIPPRLEPGSALIADVGAEIAGALVVALGYGTLGRWLDLPLLSGVERLMRDNAMRADYAGGMKENQLVERYHLSHRHVRRMLKAPGTTSPRHGAQEPRDASTFELFAAMYPRAGATQ